MLWDAEEVDLVEFDCVNAQNLKQLWTRFVPRHLKHRFVSISRKYPMRPLLKSVPIYMIKIISLTVKLDS